MPRVIDILNKKGHDVVTIVSDRPVQEAIGLMSEHRIGAVVVLEKGDVVGIFSERDLLNRVVVLKKPLETTKVRDVMSSPVAYVALEAPVNECRAAMTQKRMRHLPVIENGKLMGVISIGDVVATELAEQQTTIKYLKEYLYSSG